MMLTSLLDTIKTKLLTLYTKQIVKKSKKKQRPSSSQTSLHIGLIYTYNTSHTEAVAQAVETLQAAQQPVQVLCYLPDIHTPNVPIPFDTFTPKQINLLGQSHNTAWNSFLQTSFTHLYHLDMASDAVLDYTIAKCAAHHKIGHYQANREQLFDIMFKDLSASEELTAAAFRSMIDKMFHYIHMLKV